MHSQTIWTAALCIALFNSCLSAKLNEELVSEEELVRKERIFLAHRASIYDCFKKYIEYSDFVDSETFVTASSVEKFKDLFVDNAKVWNDYLWEPKFEYASVYADQVYYYHRVKGLKVEFDEDVLDEIAEMNREDYVVNIDTSVPSNHIYKYRFKARKGVFYILNKELKVIYYDEPVNYNLEFIFHISDEEPTAKIMDILPVSSEDK